jgi:hypothetical protein
MTSPFEKLSKRVGQFAVAPLPRGENSRDRPIDEDFFVHVRNGAVTCSVVRWNVTIEDRVTERDRSEISRKRQTN